MSFSIKAFIGMSDSLSRPLEAMNKNIRRTLAPIERLRRARINLSRSLGIDGLGRSLGRLRGQAAGALGPLTAITAGLSVAGVVNFTQRYSEAGDEIAKTSKLIGLSAEAYQELGFAAERSGIEQGTFTQSMKAFTKRLGEARQGAGSLNSFMKRLDPSIRQNVLAAESTDEAFRRLTFAMSELTSEEDRAALASAAFSRAGLGMVNMMSEGNGAVDDLRQKFRDLGGVMGTDAARDAEAYRDAVTNFQTALGGLGNLVGGKLIPVLTPFLERITDSIATFSSSEEAIAGMDDAAGKLSEVLAGFSFTGFIDGVESIAGAISGAIDFVGGWENALIGLGVLINGPLIGAFVSLGAVIAKVGIVLLANPIGAAVAAIGASVYVIYDNWGNIDAWFTEKTQKVSKAFDTGLVTGINTALLHFNPVTLFTEAINGLSVYLFGVDLAPEADALVKSLHDVINGYQTNAIKAGSDIVAKITEGIRGAVHTAVAEFTRFGQQMMDGLMAGLKAKLSEVKELIVGIGADVSGWFAKQLGIQSPSRVFMGLGGHIADGLAIGIDRGAGRVAASVAGLTSGATGPISGFAAGPPVAGPLSGGTGPGAGLAGEATVEIRVRTDQGTQVQSTRTRSSGGIKANVGRADADLTGAG